VSPATLPVVLAGGAFLALLKTPRGKHWVIVDDKGYAPFDGIVRVRDPAGTSSAGDVGAEAGMGLETFHDLWNRAFNYAVYRRP
jgi:hypothetical protein